MKRQTYLPLLCLWLISASALFSAPIQNLKFTDVVKDVKILNVATKAETTAKVGDVLVPPNVIKTGADSRAELVAEDQTVTRVGANTIFSVEANSRDVNIAKGSVLFHSPAGKGGGNIKSAGATASVLGTTLIVGANQSGGFKVMLLEGKGQVTGAGGGGTKLTAGQMSFAMPGQAPSQPLNFELKGQVSGSKLVGGFSKPLASIAKIEAAVNLQQSKIASGDMASTGLMIGDSPSVAFKVDPAVVRVTAEMVQKAKESIVRARVEQAKTEAARIERSRQILDPRFIVAVSKNLALTTPTTPFNHEQPVPLTLEKFTSGKPLSGNYTIGDDGGWGAPVRIPGSREDRKANPSGDLTMLLAKNINFNVAPAFGEYSAIFAIAPLYSAKNYNGVAALENISFTQSVDFVERLLDSQGSATDDPFVVENLFLSAGKTIIAEAGTVIKSSHATNFDIYAGGTGFLGANSRTEFFAPASGGLERLELKDTMIWNALSWMDSVSQRMSDGNLSIEAPSMNFLNVTLSAGTSAGGGTVENYVPPATISLNSPGDIQLKVDASKLAIVESYLLAGNSTDAEKNQIRAEALSQNIPLPLGFAGPEPLAVQAFNVSIESSARAITITGVPIYANRISIKTGAVPVFEASAFTPDLEVAGDHAQKLYIPFVKYDRDLNGIIDAQELTAAEAALAGKTLSGDGIPEGTRIVGVAFANEGKIELSLDRDVALKGSATEGSIASMSGTFTSGSIVVGSTGEYSAAANVSISNIILEGLNRDVGSKDPVIEIESAGNVELKTLNVSSGDNRYNDFRRMTQVDIRAKGSVLLDSSKFSSNSNLHVWADKDVTFKGVSITGDNPQDLPAVPPKFSASSNSNSVYVNTSREAIEALKMTGDPLSDLNQLGEGPAAVTRTVMKATAVSFTANNGDVVINSADFQRDPRTSASAFNASAKHTIGIYNSSIEHSKVAIAANTVVLKDVQFHGESMVSLRSDHGVVSANPGYRTSVVRGNVNILSNVRHGDYTIRFMNDGTHANPNTGAPLDPAQFNALLPAAKQGKISIGKR
jgi:hypothetical protein